MSEAQPRRFPFWLTVSVLGNLVLVGLLAGIFLKAPKPPRDFHRTDRPQIVLSDEDRQEVRSLMRASFEAGREAMKLRREAERALADTLRAEPYDEAAARAALARLREADLAAREIISERLFQGLDELSPDQRALVAKIMSGNSDRRGKRHDRLKTLKDIRGDGPSPAPPQE